LATDDAPGEIAGWISGYRLCETRTLIRHAGTTKASTINNLTQPVSLSSTLRLLMSPIAGASLLLPCVLPARFATVALPTVAMGADTEHGLTSVAASLSKQELWHADDDKPPLRCAATEN